MCRYVHTLQPDFQWPPLGCCSRSEIDPTTLQKFTVRSKPVVEAKSEPLAEVKSGIRNKLNDHEPIPQSHRVIFYNTLCMAIHFLIDARLSNFRSSPRGPWSDTTSSNFRWLWQQDPDPCQASFILASQWSWVKKHRVLCLGRLSSQYVSCYALSNPNYNDYNFLVVHVALSHNGIVSVSYSRNP